MLLFYCNERYDNDIISCIHLFLQQQLSSAQLTKLSHDLDFTFAVFIRETTYERFTEKDIKQKKNLMC